MSLHPQPINDIPEQTVAVAKAAFVMMAKLMHPVNH